MSRETKLGALAIFVLVTLIWGYKFLEGRNILSPANTFYTTYNDVHQLAVSSPVYVNGLKIGTVSSIELNSENVKEMIVGFIIEGDYGLPKSTKAVMISEGIVGGKGIALEFERTCAGANCAEDGDYFQSEIKGLLSAMIPKDELNDYVKSVTTSLSVGMDSITKGEDGPLKAIFDNIQRTMTNMADITENLNTLLTRSSNDLSQTIGNVNSLTGNLAENNEQISGVLTNVNGITKSLNDAQIGTTVEKTNTTLDETTKAIQALQATIANSDKTMSKLADLLDKFNEGEGSLSKLLNDKELYDNLAMTSKNMSLLLQDLRLNPKRYVNVSVFGKKQEKYTLPEDDPAMRGNKN